MVIERSTRQRNAIRDVIEAADRPLSPQEILEAAARHRRGPWTCNGLSQYQAAARRWRARRGHGPGRQPALRSRANRPSPPLSVHDLSPRVRHGRLSRRSAPSRPSRLSRRTSRSHALRALRRLRAAHGARSSMIHVEELRFAYAVGEEVLRLDAFELPSASNVLVVGPSGCGKTTLLHLVAGLLLPVAGRDRRCRTGSGGAHAGRPRPLSRAQHRHRPAAVPPAADPHDPAEPAGRTKHRGTAGGSRGSAGHVVSAGRRRPAARLSASVVGRATAARGHRTRTRQPAQAGAGRRADVESRRRGVRRRCGAACWRRHDDRALRC